MSAPVKLTDDMLRTLRCAWPVERCGDISAEVVACVAEHLLYIEGAGNGWVRIGLTDAGRAAVESRS